MNKPKPDSFFIGKKFNMLEVLERGEDHVCPSGRRARRFLCKCDCGKELLVYGQALGKQVSCGCLKRTPDLTGKTIGFWTVMKKVVISHKTYWKCKCVCGTIKNVDAHALSHGKTSSCGCVARIMSRRENKKNPIYNRFEKVEDYYVGYDTKGREFYVSEEDCDSIKKYLWSVGSNGYVSAMVNGKVILLHDFIMKPSDNLVVDHIKPYSMHDCRRINMRLATPQQNGMNRRRGKNNKSGVVGVRKKRRKWTADIMLNRKTIVLGLFVNFEDAVRARIEAEKRYHGEYMYKLNLNLLKYVDEGGVLPPGDIDFIDFVRFGMITASDVKSDIGCDIVI